MDTKCNECGKELLGTKEETDEMFSFLDKIGVNAKVWCEECSKNESLFKGELNDRSKCDH